MRSILRHLGICVVGLLIGTSIACLLSGIVWLAESNLRHEHPEWYAHHWSHLLRNALLAGAVVGLAGAAVCTFRKDSHSLLRSTASVAAFGVLGALFGLAVEPSKSGPSPWFAIAGVVLGAVFLLLRERSQE